MKGVAIAFAFILALLPSLAVAEDGGGFTDWSGVTLTKDGAVSPSLATCSEPLVWLQNGAGLLSVCAALAPDVKNGKNTVSPIWGVGLAGRGDYGLAAFISGNDIVLGVSLPFEGFFNNLARIAR